MAPLPSLLRFRRLGLTFARRSRWAVVVSLAPIVLLATFATALVGELARPLDHALVDHILPRVVLSEIVVVTAGPGGLQEASEAAERAGATEVWSVVDVEPALRAHQEVTGVVREFRGALLPLPEALDTWLVVDAAALGERESQLLAGRTAIVGLSDGPTNFWVPGRLEPVSTTTLAAAAYGAHAGGHTLFDGRWVVWFGPLLSLLMIPGLARSRTPAPSLLAPLTVVGWLAGGLGLRMAGIAVPLVGLAVAPLTLLLARMAAQWARRSVLTSPTRRLLEH